jgi:hypothetical protein
MGLCDPGGARGLTVGCQARNARPFVHCERAETALNRRPPSELTADPGARLRTAIRVRQSELVQRFHD